MDVLEELGEETLLGLLHPQIIIDNGLTTPVLYPKDIIILSDVLIYSGIIPYYFGKMWTPTGYHLDDGESSSMCLYNGFIRWIDGEDGSIRHVDGKYVYVDSRYENNFYTEDETKLLRADNGYLISTSFGTFNKDTDTFSTSNYLKDARLEILPTVNNTYELVETKKEPLDVKIPSVNNIKELLKYIHDRMDRTIKIDKEVLNHIINLI